MLKIYTLLASILFINNSWAISATTPSKIADGIAIERIQAYAATSTKAKKVGIVEPGTELLEFKTFTKTKPGLAMMEDNSWDKSVPFDRGANIHIWEYLGNGYSKVIINGVRYNTKIARSTTECKRFAASPRYCWARVITEPEYYEWKQVALDEEGQKFWVLNRIIDGSGIIELKDQGVEKSRVVTTKYIKEDLKKVEEKDEKEKKNNKLLLDKDLKTDTDKAKSLEAITAANLALTPEERKEQREKAKEELKKSLNQSENNKEDKIDTSKPVNEDIFNKQQNIDQSLLAPIDDNSTDLTINVINKDLQQPATKLQLEANKPLNLTTISESKQK